MISEYHDFDLIQNLATAGLRTDLASNKSSGWEGGESIPSLIKASGPRDGTTQTIWKEDTGAIGVAQGQDVDQLQHQFQLILKQCDGSSSTDSE